jgi:hypothetical protein
MKKALLLLSLILLVVLSASNKIWAQNITVNLTSYTKLDITGYDTAWVNTSFYVDTLIIGPGTVLMFSGNYGIEVNSTGFVQAIGTQAEPIKFTTNAPSAYWSGFQFSSGNSNTSVFDHCIIHNAYKTSNNGGAIYAYFVDTLIIKNSEFVNCNSDLSGGVIYMQDAYYMLISNCKFTNNYAAGQGSIVYSTNINKIDFVQNLIVNNGGYNLFFFYGTGANLVNFANNTIANNTASALSINYQSALVVNNIFSGSDVFSGVTWPNSITLNNNLFESYPPLYDYQITTCQTNRNIFGNPVFNNPSPSTGNTENGLIYDWEPQSGSLAINRGYYDTASLQLPLTDLSGDARVYDCRIDIGAYEYIGANANDLVFDCDFNGNFNNYGTNGFELGMPYQTPVLVHQGLTENKLPILVTYPQIIFVLILYHLH